MKLIVAETAGFCFGVQRALDITEDVLAKSKPPVYTYGPLIHNETVVRDLEKRGITVMDEDSNPTGYLKGTVILRSHGVPRDVSRAIEAAGHRVVDATCPFVAKIHRIVAERSAAGERILIIGDRTHPEVCGIIGQIDADCCDVIMTEEEAQNYTASENDIITVVSQTTFNLRKFQDLVEIIEKKEYHINVLNTICNATEERQEEARRLSGIADAMIVIGSHTSSNSRKLYEICKERCGRTVFIQTAAELDRAAFDDCETVGITAGASTPHYIIQEVLQGWQRKVLTRC